MSESITREELAEALRSVRIWVRRGPNERVAWLMTPLNPGDTANDIFTSVKVRQVNEP
jgi:hypothetical protein